MRSSSIITLALITAAFAFGQAEDLATAPHMNEAEPRIAKPGTEIVIKGTGLALPKVEEVYLTDHKFDMKVKVLEQKENVLTIRVPPFAKPGRMQLMILINNEAGDKPRLLEQPLYVMIEENSAVLAESKKETAKEKEKEGN
ncbi:MAG: IPT/TIG domain-containing protein [Bryobacteraceae bacterium]